MLFNKEVCTIEVFEKGECDGPLYNKGAKLPANLPKFHMGNCSFCTRKKLMVAKINNNPGEACMDCWNTYSVLRNRLTLPVAA